MKKKQSESVFLSGVVRKAIEHPIITTAIAASALLYATGNIDISSQTHYNALGTKFVWDHVTIGVVDIGRLSKIETNQTMLNAAEESVVKCANEQVPGLNADKSIIDNIRKTTPKVEGFVTLDSGLTYTLVQVSTPRNIDKVVEGCDKSYIRPLYRE